MRVAITTHYAGERIFWEDMPSVPRVGEVVFLDDGIPATKVFSTSWSKDVNGWFAEVHLGM